MEWQPIETAPRDGTYILIARAGENIGGHEPMEITSWCVMENWHYEDLGNDTFKRVMDKPAEFWNNNGHRATHWMPLPPLPPSNA